MKALEKDRTRRYESASDFARDIQRHLDDEPVEACPPSAGYRLRKFARKHRAVLATTAAFAALLIVGVVFSTWQAVRATHAEAQARSNEDKALAAADAEKQARDAEAKQRKLAEVEGKRAVEAAETALDQLSHSLFQNARTLLASNEPGRRWAALEMLRGAEALRIRQGVEDLESLLEPVLGVEG